MGGILSAVVVVQGGLLVLSLKRIDRSLKRIDRLDEAIFIHSKKGAVFIPEMRALKLTVSQLLFETREGKAVGYISSGSTDSGPRFSLRHRQEGKEASLSATIDNSQTYVTMRQTAKRDKLNGRNVARLVFDMCDGAMGLHAYPAYSDGVFPLSVGCGHRRNSAEGAPYSFWGYQVPGLPWFIYPRELSVLRKELAALTLETDEGKQRKLMGEISLRNGLGKAFPEIARLCEAHPEEKDFPRDFVRHAKGAEECRALVLESLARKPSYTMVTLLAQMIVEGQDKVGEVDLRDYLSALARRPNLPPAVKRRAEGWDKTIRERHPRKAPAKPNPDPGN